MTPVGSSRSSAVASSLAASVDDTGSNNSMFKMFFVNYVKKDYSVVEAAQISATVATRRPAVVAEAAWNYRIDHPGSSRSGRNRSGNETVHCSGPESTINVVAIAMFFEFKDYIFVAIIEGSAF